MSNLVYIDAKGDKQAVDLSLDTLREASDKGVSLRQHLAVTHPTNPEKHGSTFSQLLEQTGIIVRSNADFGIKAARVGDVLNPSGPMAGVVTREGLPASRLLFPATVLSMIEDRLAVDRETDPAAFESMIAVQDTVAGERWERPVLNFSKPEAARSAPVAQLALPGTMLSITVADKAGRVPSWGIGMEISEQAQRATSLDLVGLAMARQAAVERSERAQGYVLSLLNGDADLGQASLASIPGKVVAASALDSAATSGLTWKAWLAWTMRNSTKRRITHVMTDIGGLMAIAKATGRFGYTPDTTNVTPSLDTNFGVMNPRWAKDVNVFLVDNAAWPAGTIVGLDSAFAIQRITSLSAQYSAVEQFVLKRSTAFRVDAGELVQRLFDEAFDVLTFTP